MALMIAFSVFSSILIGSSIAVVSSRNPVHSVLFLILAFFNAAALFLIAGAEFLAMVLIIVYVGAVAVLFLFVVMMLDVSFDRLREGYQQYLPVGSVVGVVLLTELVLVLGGSRFAQELSVHRAGVIRDNVQNTVALGHIIYTQYVLLFQVAGLILLVAMIGAIVLTHRERHSTKRQSVAGQNARTAAETLEIVSVALGVGTGVTGLFRPHAENPKLNTVASIDAPDVTVAGKARSMGHE